MKSGTLSRIRDNDAEVRNKTCKRGFLLEDFFGRPLTERIWDERRQHLVWIEGKSRTYLRGLVWPFVIES